MWFTKMGFGQKIYRASLSATDTSAPSALSGLLQVIWLSSLCRSTSLIQSLLLFWVCSKTGSLGVTQINWTSTRTKMKTLMPPKSGEACRHCASVTKEYVNLFQQWNQATVRTWCQWSYNLIEFVIIHSSILHVSKLNNQLQGSQVGRGNLMVSTCYFPPE